MANLLPVEKKITAVSALAEGNSIRSVERMTGVHRDTIMRLGVRVGTACTQMMDETMKGLQCSLLELDEIWGFIGKKERNVEHSDSVDMGDVWTWVAIDAKSKAIPSFHIGKRQQYDADRFAADLSGRMANRVQISTDGLNQYLDAIEKAFGSNVDYGKIVKTYRMAESDTQRRYSPTECVSVKRKKVSGEPDISKISTSYVERQNLTMRMHCRRLTRLTNAFSKKLENFKAAIGLHFAYYNFVKIHSTIRCTPAMELGVADSQWSVADLVELSE